MLFKINAWSHNVYLHLFFHLKCFEISPIYVLLQPLHPFQEKEMATHSSTLVWKIPGMEEPGGLRSMGSIRVGHDWVTSLSLFTFMHWEGNSNPLQCSCLENPRDGWARWAAVYGVAQSWTRLKWLSSSSSSFTQFKLFISQKRKLKSKVVKRFSKGWIARAQPVVLLKSNKNQWLFTEQSLQKLKGNKIYSESSLSNSYFFFSVQLLSVCRTTFLHSCNQSINQLVSFFFFFFYVFATLQGFTSMRNLSFLPSESHGS